ncbi:MAG: hypothetical protein P8Y80_02625 [Acidobacteriota bacterium]
MIVNRIRSPLPRATMGSIDTEGLELLCAVPEDTLLFETDQGGKPIWPVIDRSNTYRVLGKALERLMR